MLEAVCLRFPNQERLMVAQAEVVYRSDGTVALRFETGETMTVVVAGIYADEQPLTIDVAALRGGNNIFTSPG